MCILLGLNHRLDWIRRSSLVLVLARVAQLVEHQTFNLRVAGSIPAPGTMTEQEFNDLKSGDLITYQDIVSVDVWLILDRVLNSGFDIDLNVYEITCVYSERTSGIGGRSMAASPEAWKRYD